MKKYIVFAFCVLALYPIGNILSGFVLTALYDPDVAGAYAMAKNLPQETEFGAISSPWVSVLTTLLIATGARAVAQIVFRKAKPGRS